MNSNRKGKVGEREWRDQLREAGFLKSYRSQQYCGTADSSDVICPELPTLHFEVKRVETLNIYSAIEQAQQDCGQKLPVVAHRKNGKQWLVTVPSEVFFALLRESSLLDRSQNNAPKNT